MNAARLFVIFDGYHPMLVTLEQLAEVNEPETMEEIEAMAPGERTILGMCDHVWSIAPGDDAQTVLASARVTPALARKIADAAHEDAIGNGAIYPAMEAAMRLGDLRNSNMADIGGAPAVLWDLPYESKRELARLAIAYLEGM